eukprot:SAG31_NODE_44878_length_261_cov_0.629630_1_plen_26_part_01
MLYLIRKHVSQCTRFVTTAENWMRAN